MEDEGVVGLVLIDYGRDKVSKFRISGVIGNAVDGSRVYKAEWEASWSDEKCLTAAMRFARVSDGAEFERLKSGVDAYESLGSRAHLLRHYGAFYYKEYYCVPFPYMKHGSLATLMADRFPTGLPEPCIVRLLFRLLTILRSVRHCELCAAHVYVVQLPDGMIDIVVGFAAMLHHLVDRYDYSYPASACCVWAAAPELHYAAAAPQSETNNIWLIGITALELAYGGLHFCSRGDLESLINTIHHQNQLPGKLHHEEERRRWLKDHATSLPSSLNTNKRRAPARFQFTQAKEMTRMRMFSKAFIRFLADCLHFQPRKRPQIFQLLQYRLFDQVKNDGSPLINLSPYYDHDQWMIRNNIDISALLNDKALTTWTRMQYRSSLFANRS